MTQTDRHSLIGKLILVAVVLSSCASEPLETPALTAPEVEPTLQEAQPSFETPQTETPEETIPIETQIIIDGDPGDWTGYEVIFQDSMGDHQGGGFDIAAVRAFSNDRFLYVLIETHAPMSDFVQLDLDISAGGSEFVISLQLGGPGFMGEVTGGQYQSIGEVKDGESAFGDAVEYKMPLSSFEDTSNMKLGIRPMGGECCAPGEWYSIDDTSKAAVAQVDELELVAEVPETPRVCGSVIAPIAAFGAMPVAPIELQDPGFSAEWFVAPGVFNMPQEILLTPDGEVLVNAVRSHTLSRLSMDGEVSLLAENVWGYLGDVDADGNIYLHMHPSGLVTKISLQGRRSTVAHSPKIQSACDSGFGFGPDGNLYVAVSRCAEKSDLIRITPSGGITELVEVPQIQALRTTSDGRFLAATTNMVYELNLEDYSLTELAAIPGGDISPGGMAIDDSGNIYISTGARRHGGQLYRLTGDGSDLEAQLVVDIPENGITGIEWLAQTGEIIGGQLRQGGVLAVKPDGTIREIVNGNGIITPMGIGFSPCGELAVPNDDGGMMTLVGPSGEVSWLMDYLAFIPPMPFVAFDPDGTLYASEAEPMPHTPKRVAALAPGGMLRTLVHGKFPSGLARGSDGVLYFSETTAGRITSVDPDGTRTVIAEGLNFPQALALDLDGNLYAVTGPKGFVPDPSVFPAPISGDTVMRISPSGDTSVVVRIPGATGLAVSPEGDMFISVSTLGSDRKVSSVIRVRPDGAQTVFATGFGDATGIAFDLAGNLYVADEVLNYIARIGGFPQGILSGKVIDSSGAPIERARVQILSADPIVVGQVVQTDSEGRFSITAAPRTYSVIVSAQGFQTTTLDNIVASADAETTVEVDLEQ
jgi:sugar lactone lactonase YvrE